MTTSFLAFALALMAAPGAVRSAQPRGGNPPADKPPATYPFSFDTLLAEAKRRAATPYAPQRNTLPAGLDKLSPEQYRSIRFNPDAGIWRADQLPFRLELLRAGQNLQTTAVTVSTVEDGMAEDLVATPAMFDMDQGLPQLGKVSLPLSGFRVRSQINSKKVWDEFLVFQGASYFRAVAQHLLYGLSARGLAINTAEPSGEEFPAFTHFWIERPSSHATSIVINALLESDSTTGAYRFTVKPGVETVMDVEMTLFPRAEMRVVGIAPLTSMFLFDETNRGRLDDYRPEVHDSDGLQITSKSGEHIFRQLANPIKLQVSTFTTQPRKVSAWCSARAKNVISRISKISMSGGRAHGSSRKAIGAEDRWNWSRFHPAAKPMTTSSPFGALRTARLWDTRLNSPTASPGSLSRPCRRAWVWSWQPGRGRASTASGGCSSWISSVPAKKPRVYTSIWAPPPARSRISR